VGRNLATLAAIATILTFVFQFVIGTEESGSPRPVPSASEAEPGGVEEMVEELAGTCDPVLSLSRGSGPSGTEVTVSGTGFPAGARVETRFHTEDMTPSETDAAGEFELTVVIPGTFDPFAPQQFSIGASTRTRVCFADTPFQLTAT
jgi:hypothetical protein